MYGMNIHPLFVHFPIGLLVAYSVLEVGSYVLPALRRQSWLFGVKAFLLFVGFLGALAALATGGMAEDMIKDSSDIALLEMHATFAAATTALYLILSVAYLVRIFDTKGWGNYVAGVNRPFIRIWSFKKYVTHLMLDTWLLPAFALVALAGMTVVGALGAAIVYGPDLDPFVSFIYHLLLAQ